MGLLDGKKVLIAGVTNDDSLAYAASMFAQREGAEVVWTSVGRLVRIAERVARRLDTPVDVIDLDVTDESSIASLGEELSRRWNGRVDGVVHAIGNANPETCLGGDILKAPWEDVSAALHISAYSLMALARMALPMMKEHGGSIVAFDFDNSRVAWPVYDWMGVAKSALESTARYLARDLGPLGVRVNLVAAGPLRSISARSIPGYEEFESAWTARAPLGWDVRDMSAAGRAAVALLSDWFPATTGEIVHVDGGYHAIGA